MASEVTQHQWGDDWDETQAGVRVPPIDLGTVVEVFDQQRDQLVIGTVTKRITAVTRPSRSAPSGPRTVYMVQCGDFEIRASREFMSVFDRSPEAIEAWLEGDRPRTAEEIERFLDDA